MRKSSWLALGIVAGLAFFTFSSDGALASSDAGGSAASCQDDGLVSHSELGGNDACREACQTAHSQCVSACSVHGNPVECEGTCQDQLDDCLMDCP